MYALNNDNILYSFGWNLPKKTYTLRTCDSNKITKEFATTNSGGKIRYTAEADYSQLKEIFDIDYFVTLKNVTCESGYFYVYSVHGDKFSLSYLGEKIPGWEQVDRNEYIKDVTASEIDRFYVKKTSYTVEEEGRKIGEEYKEVTLEEFLQAREMYDVKKI